MQGLFFLLKLLCFYFSCFVDGQANATCYPSTADLVSQLVNCLRLLDCITWTVFCCSVAMWHWLC